MPALTYEVRYARRLEAFERFVRGVGVPATPSAVRAPYSHGQWTRLDPDTRRAHLQARATEELRATDDAQRTTTARSLAVSASEPDALNGAKPAPSGDHHQEFVAGRSYLPCADGCGTWHRARAERPGLRFCKRR